MLTLEVRRDLFTSLSSGGRLAIDGLPFCYTLEPPRIPMPTAIKPRAIPSGIKYKLTIRWSLEHNCPVPHVEDVPGFTAVEIHIGNFPGDSLACTLVGKTRGPQPNYIGLSAVAFTHLMSKLYAGATLTNPDSPERNHVWDVGTIIYTDFDQGDPNAI